MMLLLLAPLAAAYTLTGEALSDAQLPLVLRWTGTVPGLTAEDVGAALEGAAAAWEEAAACGLDIQVVEDPAADQWFRDGGVAVLFGDPDGTLDDGVLALTVRGESSGETFERNGATFSEAAPVEIVVNDVPMWVTDAAIAGGTCADQLSLQAMLTHELGHVLGLGDSCSEGEACTDEAALAASMYWAMETCDASQSTLGSDDVAGLAAIYGEPFAFGFTCEPTVDDPLTVTCAVTDPADAGSLSPTWSFGDGATDAGDAVTHTFAASGTYEVALCVLPPECGGERCETTTVAVSADLPDTGGDTGADPSGDTGDDPSGDTGGDPSSDASATSGCGCASSQGLSAGSSPAAAPWLGAALAALALRRRR